MTTKKINKEVLVKATPETAFNVFCEKMDLWWPRSHHVGGSPMLKMLLEQRPQGRWYSIHQSGQECLIGHVKTFEPHSHLVLIWQLGSDFVFNPNLVTEVELRFEKVAEDRTLVKFEHRNLERLGNKETGMDQGWGMIMGLYEQIASHGRLEGEKLASYERRNVVK